MIGRDIAGMNVAPRRASSGVTLLELLIVLSIMAILAAVVLPLLGGSGVSTGELKSAARQVAAGLRVARSEALATRQETRVVLDLEQRTFRVDRDAHVHTLPNGGRVTLAAGSRKYDIDIDWLTGRVAIQD
jgi:general secretion pathway protein H